MFDIFDSRALRHTDCYGQRFMKVGSYNYNVLPIHGHYVTIERPFRVNVVERTARTLMKQHTVVVSTNRNKFRAEPAEILIEAGDLILWNCPEPNALPYIVVGDKEFFASHRMVNESGYSHAFGMAGEYAWVDAYGSDVSGLIRVKNPDCKNEADYQEWHKSLMQGTLVMISDGRAEPSVVDIVTGQTVFFAITKGTGISITDRRLLRGKIDQE